MNDSAMVQYHYGVMLPNTFTEKEACTLLSKYVPKDILNKGDDLEIWEYMQEELPVTISSAGIHMEVDFWFVRVRESSMSTLHLLSAAPDFSEWDPEVPKWDNMLRKFCGENGIELTFPCASIWEDPELQGLNPKKKNHPRWLCALQIGY